MTKFEELTGQVLLRNVAILLDAVSSRKEFSTKANFRYHMKFLADEESGTLLYAPHAHVCRPNRNANSATRFSLKLHQIQAWT